MSFITQVVSLVPPCTRIWRTTTQTIPASTWTLISFNTTPIEDDVGGFSAGTPTRITVPNGFRRCRVTGYANWSNVVGGVRGLRLDFTGVTYAVDLKNAVFETGNQIQTDWINVVGGDYLELLAFTDSAAVLQGTGFGGSCRMQVEFDRTG